MYGSYGIYTERKGFAVTLWYGGAYASTLDFQFCHDNPSKQSHQKGIQVVVSNISYFHPYLGRWSSLTNMFQMGWFNHQLGKFQELVNFSLRSARSRRGVRRLLVNRPIKRGLWQKKCRRGSSMAPMEWPRVSRCHVFLQAGPKKVTSYFSRVSEITPFMYRGEITQGNPIDFGPI